MTGKTLYLCANRVTHESMPNEVTVGMDVRVIHMNDGCQATIESASTKDRSSIELRLNSCDTS